MTFYSSAPAYPELFAVVGARVPDFRGLFLRGVGGSAAPLGVQQGDAIRNITGGGPSTAFTNATDGDSGALGTVRWQHDHDWFGGWGGSGFVGGLILDASRVVPTAEENRPVNKAVRYFIRSQQ